MLGRRELAGALWLPALFLILFVAGWGKLDAGTAVAVIATAFVGLWGVRPCSAIAIPNDSAGNARAIIRS